MWLLLLILTPSPAPTPTPPPTPGLQAQKRLVVQRFTVRQKYPLLTISSMGVLVHQTINRPNRGRGVVASRLLQIGFRMDLT